MLICGIFIDFNGNFDAIEKKKIGKLSESIWKNLSFQILIQ